MKRNFADSALSARRINRRALILGGAQAALMAGLGFRMRHMQVDQAEEFRLLAEENRINMRLIAPARGLIFDRNGVVVAENAQNYRIVIVREDAGDVDEVVDRLRRLVHLDEAELERSLREMHRRSPFVPVTLADRLSWEDIAEVAVNTPALPGVTTEVGQSRHYPMSEDFSHVVGYVGPVSDYDLSRVEDPDPLLQIPKFQIGKTGVENKLEHLLRGKAGSRRIEVNAAGRVMRELERHDGTAGADLQLTVDHRLQNFVQARLAGESGAAVVMDVWNGDILAIGSAPGFDPNLFVRGISTTDYSALTENMYRPLANKTVQGTYPPGSTFKLVTAIAALEAGAAGYDSTVWCPGYLNSGGRRFHCWKSGGHGHMNLHDALQQSCDVYFYEVANRCGIDKISEVANRFGLGVRHDLPMSAVAEGLTPTREWKRLRRGEDWMPGDTLNASIGQGFVLASPLQLAVMTARVASGRAVQPRLVKSIGGVETDVVEDGPLAASDAHLQAVRRGMYAVSNTSRGTAYRTRIEVEALRMAGKTGTSQVRNITAAERARGVFRNEDLPWERRDHALFVGYAPYDAPRYAVSVVIEHGGGGSAVAAPVARDVMLAALHDGAVPPLEAYPAAQREEIREQQEALPLRPMSAQEPGRSRA
ncbi:penicillin-binding protein 2 [Roseitranquillus sediminis]|uniref:penicillin-binding protein 2 n=1 Tax=Roseitranquillus sediminis TaxID=2809051 RepID=UPI001D0C5F9A|nr:penicillin-binding protein 2 [Roseitranquillus sediminis]MBM9594521.1 penicillin-binding protein 2 [Roseitranquillus sediminis]